MCLGHNSLWYAFVTDGVHVVILPAGSQQGLGMGPSLLSPIWHCSNGWYWCTGGLVSIQLYQCCSGGQSWEEHSSPGIPVFQGHLQLAAPEPWCTTHAGWTGCCCAHWLVSFYTEAQGMVHLYNFCSLSDCQHFYHDVLQNHRGRPPPSVGFWSMWHKSHSGMWGDEDSSWQICCNSTAYNTATCLQWDNCSQWWMGSIQPRPTPTICWTA